MWYEVRNFTLHVVKIKSAKRMKIQLTSDFSDFYDHWFCGAYEKPNRTFDRASRTTMSKRQQFQLLQEMGFNVPSHGTVTEVVERLAGTQQEQSPPLTLVGYTDEFAHAGEGKIIRAYYYLISEQPHLYCSEFIPTSEDTTISISYRLLQVGDRAWWLKYEGRGSWMSNHAPDVTVEVLHEAHGFWDTGEEIRPKQYPLFAIDFVVPVGSEKKLAIDFNTAPGLKQTGMEEILSAKECYELIAEWMLL